MSHISTIGVLGGMGPEATNQLCSLITANTPVSRDQDHIPVITFNNSLIPERVKAVNGGGISPVPEMIRTAQVLERAGADMILMPCNLAHFFLAEVQAGVRVPVLDMIEETVKYAVEHHTHFRQAGILASTPTIRCGLYEEAFRKYDKRLLAPDERVQEENVMRAIYGTEGIKRGHKSAPRALLIEAAEQLVAAGAEVIVAGCTEVSLVLTRENSPFVVIDPLEIIARVAIERARAGEGASAPRETPAASL